MLTRNQIDNLTREEFTGELIELPDRFHTFASKLEEAA